jgi:hypothetical protein
MTLEERLNYCKICTNRSMDQATGIVCSLTGAKPVFEDQCPDFKADEKQIEYYKNRQEAAENEDAETDGGFFGAEKKGLQKGVLGGIAMMLIAVVWFVIGYQAGYIYFYPPILFIIGLVGLIKGVIQGNVSGKN